MMSAGSSSVNPCASPAAKRSRPPSPCRLGQPRRLGDVLREPVEAEAAHRAAAAGQRAQVPAIAATEIDDEAAAFVNLPEDRHAGADGALEEPGVVRLQHRAEPGQDGLALRQHLLARPVAAAHQPGGALGHVRVQHHLHRDRHQRARRVGAHRGARLAQAERVAIRLQIAEGIGGIAPAADIGGIHPCRGGDGVASGGAGLAERGEQAVNHADIGDGEALRALRHAAELLLQVGLFPVGGHVVRSRFAVAVQDASARRGRQAAAGD